MTIYDQYALITPTVNHSSQYNTYIKMTKSLINAASLITRIKEQLH